MTRVDFKFHLFQNNNRFNIRHCFILTKKFDDDFDFLETTDNQDFKRRQNQDFRNDRESRL